MQDELIREVSINSPERGLLLLRVRDEIRLTMDSYKTLYESRYDASSYTYLCKIT
jgi:dynein light intermediate chain